MITVEEHLAAVLALAEPLDAELMPVAEGFGRTLARPMVARFAVPPFDNSAMDGYAVRAVDVERIPCRLPVVADIPAGATTRCAISPGEAARIMTGAPMPAGADAVVPVEDTDQPSGAAPLPEVVEVLRGVIAHRHVRRRGEDVEVGTGVLEIGQTWTAEAAAAAASVGYGEVWLRRRARVAVLATGDELVAPGLGLSHGQIPDSNSVLIAGLIGRSGAEVALTRAVRDDPAEFRSALELASAADVVVTSGGVSAGAFEVVRQSLVEDVSFVKVAMQPGKPQGVGTLLAADGRRVPILCLPGNPVSVSVSAHVFLAPLLDALHARESRRIRLSARAAVGWRSPAGRRQFVPVAFDGVTVTPTHGLGSGSHLIASLHRANALAVVAEDVTRVEADDEVAVELVAFR